MEGRTSKKRRLQAGNAATREQDESDLLASLGSSLQNTDQYEQDVLKTAELEAVPKLFAPFQGEQQPLGFPPLQSLAPSGRAISDVPHMQTVLAKVRQQLVQRPHNLKLLLQQQILLNLIHTTTNDFEKCLRPQEELRHEQVRRQRFRRQLQKEVQQAQNSHNNNNLRGLDSVATNGSSMRRKEGSATGTAPGRTSLKSAVSSSARSGSDDEHVDAGDRLESIKAGKKSVSFATNHDTSSKLRGPKPHRRIGIQKRRRAKATSKSGSLVVVDEETEDEVEQRKNSLRMARAEREQRRQQRRKKWAKMQSRKTQTNHTSDSDENEFEFDVQASSTSETQETNGTAATSTTTAIKQEDTPGIPVESVLESNTTEIPTVPAPIIKQEPETIVSASCPICNETVEASSQADVDAALSQHMNDCQTSQRRTRGQRQSGRRTQVSSYAEVDEDFVDDEDRKPSAPTASVSHGVLSDSDNDNDGDDDQDGTFQQPVEGDDDEDESLVVDLTMDDVLPDKHRKGKTKKTEERFEERYGLQPSVDDFDEEYYEDRVDDWVEGGISRMRVMKERDVNELPPGEEVYEGGLTIPAWINDRLFPYQRTGLRWMWELHRQQAGGIIGDEMGLGKTVQMAAFLGSMASSRKLKSVLVIAPATMLQHWLSELKIWAPGLRRILIHQSAEGSSFTAAKRSISYPLLHSLDHWLKDCRRSRLFEAIDEEDYNSRDPSSFCGTGYVVVTTYENVRRFADVWTGHTWSYVVMDEAQKIRNPDADVTLVCKRLRTPHRLALSGTPIQNDLRELWSLFDFVFPGRLGTLPAFENEFADPIKRGGYSNASPMQVQLAYRCALMLRGLINPYLLRRLKKDIKEVNRMPGKKEQVLFCRLSDRQRTMYEAFLLSDQVKQVLRGSAQMLGAITTLRKICNHPDLICPPDNASLDTFLNKGFFSEADSQMYSDDECEIDEEEGLTDRSGKLEVLAKILPLWKKQGHRVLIFCQWKKMLNIIQRFTELQGWKFGRLDGSTNVAARQRLVDTFNSDESYYGMLMTTRTGGVGLNLTGADRIILYDPDWNPQTDAQARERARRFGQEREVTIYRLIAAGTVEEKIYQRQIFKTALSNRVLQDPRQRRLFSQKDLKDLFSLKVDDGSVISGSDGITETGQLTKGEGYIDPDEEAISPETNKDDGETMHSVLQSKGLAGVFDHDIVENTPTNKKGSVREMEEKAREVANAALGALKESVQGQGAFTPTWTGSEEAGGRFGSRRRDSTGLGGGSSSAGVLLSGGASNGKSSSSSLLASVRRHKDDIRSNGNSALSGNGAKEYTELLQRIKEFVRRHAPTTDEILYEFASVQEHDAAVFRRLLKSVARVTNGVWKLKSR